MSFHLSKSPRITSKNKSLHNKIRDDDFSLLYPTRSKIPRFINDTAQLHLHYQRTKLKVTIPLYVETAYLEQIFYEAIFRFQNALQPEKAIKETAKIIGFQSIDHDILLDYRITIGNGILDRVVDFRCMQYLGNKKVKPLQKYKIIKCLAIGGFSKVYLVRSHYDGKFYAMKAVSKSFITQNQRQNVVLNQKSICSKLQHPFIVSLKHCFQSQKFACFVFECITNNNLDCPGGELFYYLKSVKRMNQQKAKFYFLEILYGLQYLHQKGIIYRDLKPENLLINVDGHIKIADFGLSKQNMQDSLTHSFCGSAQYMPPEMILKTGHSFGVDYYTLGALLYELVTGLPPYYSQDQQQLKSAILNDQLTFPENIQISDDLKMLLKGLLNKNQKQRLGSLKGIKQILFHPWLGKVNTDKIIKKKMTPPYLPDVNEFNFDENQLGQDEIQFTHNLILDSKTNYQSEEPSIFPDFYYQGQFNLRPQQYKILKDSRSITKVKRPIKSSHLYKSSSVKALHNNNYILNRQLSSPYLQTLYKKQKLVSSFDNKNQTSSSYKILSRQKPKKRTLPKYINTFMSESINTKKIRRNNFKKVL